MLAAELAKPPRMRGEILVFQRTKSLFASKKSHPADSESQEKHRTVVAANVPSSSQSEKIVAGKDVFHWEDLCYDIKVKGGTRRLLNNVDGWVKPGVSTILMV